ncbi:MAG: hypothetical protein ACREI2_10415 [Nitrospiraceae bacterium]
MRIDQLHPKVGKRLFDVSDAARYLGGSRDLNQVVFCDHCGRNYQLGDRVVDGFGMACCPSRVGFQECDGTLQHLIEVLDMVQLAKLRAQCKPAYPFSFRKTLYA